MTMITDILVMKGLLDEDKLIALQKEFGDTKELERELVTQRIISEHDYYNALAVSMNLPFKSISDIHIDENIIELLPESLIKRNYVIPIELINNDTLVLGMVNPNEIMVIDDVSSITGYKVQPVVITPEELDNCIARHLRSDDEITSLSESMSIEAEVSEAESLEINEDDEPVVRFVNLIVTQAIQDRASDIHIEPEQTQVVIRYRIDGVLHKVQTAPKNMQDSIISRMKIVSNINIAEKRKPQDGRMTVNYNGKTIDLRVATLPAVWGENVVMRILDNNATSMSLQDMKMSDHNYEIFSKSFQKPHGMIVVTGPTGSGKALKLDTRIPTPTGWTTMGDIKVGDKVLDSKGLPTNVTSVSDVDENPELYKVVLSDGQIIYADGNHQWIVASHSSRNSPRHHKTVKRRNNIREGLLAASKAKTLAALYDEDTYITLKEAFEQVKIAGLDSHVPSKESLIATIRFMDGEVIRDKNPKGLQLVVNPHEAFELLSDRLHQRHNLKEKEILSTMTTSEMFAEGLQTHGRTNFSIPLVAESNHQYSNNVDLPIDPYLLGAWLGDGTTGGGYISSGYSDAEEMTNLLEKSWRGTIETRDRSGGRLIRLVRPELDKCILGHEYVEGKNYCVSHNEHYGKQKNPVSASLGELLARHNLRGNKHIPMNYLRASFDQRLALLQGLMDTDGYASKDKRGVGLGFSHERLANDTLELVRSLGIKATMTKKKAGYKNKDGKFVRCKDTYSINFVTTLPVFRLQRKLDRIPTKVSETQKWIYITAIEKIEKSDPNYGPVKCITVDSPDSSYLCEDFIITHNSTTLYTALNAIASESIKVITVEDPVEYRISGVNQVQVNPRAGLTFDAALRSILRSDPDVVLVGEIRDAETARMSIEASLTGHLVLSTVHTNDAPSTITRLIEMDVEPFLVGSALECVVAQRLARVLCQKCKKAVTVDQSKIDALKLPITTSTEIYEPVGCSSCSHTGYRGRIALHEIMHVSEEIERLTVERASSADIRSKAIDEGMTTLRMDGWDKVMKGLTSISEVLRVVA